MRNKNWFWGSFFVVAAAAVIANQLGYFTNINLISLVLTIFCIPIIISSAIHLNFFGILFPLAGLAIIYAEPLGITSITPWTVLIAALLGSIGFSIIFHKHTQHDWNKWRNTNNPENFGEVVNIEDPDSIDFKVSFGSSIKYVNSKDLKRANLSCSFGALKVYFDNATVNENGAEIYIDSSFGGMELYIPKTWKLVNNVSVSLGGVDEKNRRSDVDAPIVTLNGTVKFSGVEIIYV